MLFFCYSLHNNQNVSTNNTEASYSWALLIHRYQAPQMSKLNASSINLTIQCRLFREIEEEEVYSCMYVENGYEKFWSKIAVKIVQVFTQSNSYVTKTRCLPALLVFTLELKLPAWHKKMILSMLDLPPKRHCLIPIYAFNPHQ